MNPHGLLRSVRIVTLHRISGEDENHFAASSAPVRV